MIERIRNKNGNILNGLNEFLSSKLFPFMTATVSLLCYYLGLDIVFIYYVGITGLVILLFCDDISPLITVLLFMCVLVSYENSPSNLAENAPYYFQTEILVQIFFCCRAVNKRNFQRRLQYEKFGLRACNGALLSGHIHYFERQSFHFPRNV